MERTLRLVGTESDGQSQNFDVMSISRPDRLGEIANLGLTLAEGKLLLAQVQQQVVAAQAHHHVSMLRPDCQSCGRRYHAKGWRSHQIATLFGEARVKLPGWHVLAAVVATPVSVGHRTVGRRLS